MLQPVIDFWNAPPMPLRRPFGYYHSSRYNSGGARKAELHLVADEDVRAA